MQSQTSRRVAVWCCSELREVVNCLCVFLPAEQHHCEEHVQHQHTQQWYTLQNSVFDSSLDKPHEVDFNMAVSSVVRMS